MNTKTFINWLRTLTSTNTTSKMEVVKERYNEIFWSSQPSLLASIWMKADFKKMNPIDFVAKYLVEMESEGISEDRKQIISRIILPMYKTLTGREYRTEIEIS